MSRGWRDEGRISHTETLEVRGGRRATLATWICRIATDGSSIPQTSLDGSRRRATERFRNTGRPAKSLASRASSPPRQFAQRVGPCRCEPRRGVSSTDALALEKIDQRRTDRDAWNREARHACSKPPGQIDLDHPCRSPPPSRPPWQSRHPPMPPRLHSRKRGSGTFQERTKRIRCSHAGNWGSARPTYPGPMTVSRGTSEHLTMTIPSFLLGREPGRSRIKVGEPADARGISDLRPSDALTIDPDECVILVDAVDTTWSSSRCIRRRRESAGLPEPYRCRNRPGPPPR